MGFESYTPKGTTPAFLCDEHGNRVVTRRQACEQQNYENPDAIKMEDERLQMRMALAAKYAAKKGR